MNAFRKILIALRCASKEFKTKKDILKKGGRINGDVKLSIGKGSSFSYGKALFLNGSGITASKRLQIIIAGGTLSFGNYSGISSSSIWCKNKIEIGNNVNIGAECLIIDTDFHSTSWEDRADRSQDVQNAKSAPIKIGDYVFIGARCIILKGVKIGEKTIIMAGSVVTKDIPSNCIAGGNPCQVLKQLSHSE